ncbi:MAG TPA: phosphatase PAP2 family protein [Longimicrobiales bacterium]
MSSGQPRRSRGSSPPRADGPGERSALAGPLYALLRFIARHVRGFWAALAAFLTLGVIIGLAAAALFGAMAGLVSEGLTQRIDETALRWLETRRSPLMDEIMMDITTLGDGVVLIMIAVIASVFLWITQHRWSVYILMIGMIGGKLLNTLLKTAFDRTRPSVVEWMYEVTSPSFPSGHAMGAFVTYGTVAYLVGRLGSTPRLRLTTWLLAALMILAIGISRMYLGVHYPSDVIAGFLAGLAWLGFVIASLAAVRYFAPRRPETEVEERDLEAGPPGHSPAPRRAAS